MRIKSPGKLSAYLSAGALVILPMTSFSASPSACPAGICTKGNAAPRTTDFGRRIFLGVLVQPLTSELAEVFGVKDSSGALISQVFPQSPAEGAGLKEGDVITAIDGTEIKDGAALQNHIDAQKSDAIIEIQYQRGNATRTAQVKLRGSAADQHRKASDFRKGDIFGGFDIADSAVEDDSAAALV